MTIWVDEFKQERCDEISDLSFEQLRCGGGLGGRHLYDDGMRAARPSDTYPGAYCVVETCSCGRWRRRTFSNKSHELLTQSYGGGVLLTGPFKAIDVYYAYWRAYMERQRKALQSVR
jgi:hypothetical protein